MRIEIIKEIEELKEYRNQWREILQGGDRDIAFIEMDWIVAWWSYFGKQGELFIIITREENNILGFCPLMRIQRRGYMEITFVGNPQSSYMDFVIKEEDKNKVIPFVIDYLFALKGKYLYNFHGVFEDNRTYQIVCQYLKQHKIPCLFSELPCYYQEIDGDFNKYFNNSFGKKTQSTMRRKEKRLHKIGEINFKRVNPQNIEEIFRIHDKRWKRKVGNSEFSEGETELFFKELAFRKDMSFQTSVDVITLNNQIIAFIYGFTCRGRYIFYRIAHDDDFYAFSPGEIVLGEKIKQCFEKGVSIFDFGVGYEPYKAEWANHSVNAKTIIFSNHAFIPKLIYRKYKILQKIKSCLKKSKVMVYFKKHTLGKIKYMASHEYRSQVYSGWKRAVKKRGVPSLLMSPIFSQEEYLIASRKPVNIREEQILDTSYKGQELTIGSIEEIQEILGEKPSDIVRKLSLEHRFWIIKKGDKVVFYCWIGNNTIHIPQMMQVKKINKKSAMMYDVHFLAQEEVSLIWKSILKKFIRDAYAKDYREIYIGCTGKQIKLLEEAMVHGFQLKEKSLRRVILGKSNIQIKEA